ncbi:phage tail protein [Streptomyces sp. NPDC126497]|uniref:phage tail protein n=1 Tax=Streptomyces sp. NPDC126497 TaxID=3155313 RepID=UPI00332639CB
MLPESIPTVRVTARYLAPDGTPLTGTVEFRPPALLTHSDTDVFVGGPTTAALDADGRLAVVLPATDAPGWNPVDWTYRVTEKVSGLPTRNYRIALAAAHPAVDLADVRPADPSTPNYVAVPGPPGPQGELGPAGPPGPVRSVNGRTTPDITLTAADVGALAVDTAGVPSGVAQLGTDGKVPLSQLPALGGQVASVNGRTGEVVITAADLSALTQAAGDARYLPIDGSPVTSVNGKAGAVQLTASDVAAVAAGTAVTLTGDQTVAGAKTFTTPPSTAALPSSPDHLASRAYVDSVAAAGMWTPSALGFTAWAFDPATAADASEQSPLTGHVYLIGVPLYAPATINSVVFYLNRYSTSGGAISASSFAGLYNSAGRQVGTTTALTNHFKATTGATVVCPLRSAYEAPAGLYWVALLLNGTTSGLGLLRGASQGDFPGGSARMPDQGIARHARLSTTGQTSLPSSFAPASAVVADANAIWAAVA